MPWYAVYERSTGRLVSTGTVLAAVLSPLLASKEWPSDPSQGKVWNPATLGWDPAPAEPAPVVEVIGLAVDFRSATGTALAWTNMPNTLQEIFNSTIYRRVLNLAAVTTGRLTVEQSVAGAANAQMKLQHSTDGAAWADSGPVLAVGAGTGRKAGAWTPLVAAAKGDLIFRIAGTGGDGVADPAFHRVSLEAR